MQDLPGSHSRPKVEGIDGALRHPRTLSQQNQAGAIRVRREYRMSRLKTPQPVVSTYQMSRAAVAVQGIGQPTDGFSGQSEETSLAYPTRHITNHDGGENSSSSSLGEGDTPRLDPKRKSSVRYTVLKCIE